MIREHVYKMTGTGLRRARGRNGMITVDKYRITSTPSFAELVLFSKVIGDRPPITLTMTKAEMRKLAWRLLKVCIL
jgi:hypothetical protein